MEINSTKNNQINIAKGVLQGSELSPLLYNIYIDDLLDELNDINEIRNTRDLLML